MIIDDWGRGETFSLDMGVPFIIALFSRPIYSKEPMIQRRDSRM